MRLRMLGVIFLMAVIAAVVVPYGGMRLYYRAVGRQTVPLRRADGSVSFLTVDPRMQPPDWLRFPPGTQVVDASSTTYSNRPDVDTGFQLTVKMALPALRRYFVDSLTAQGFVMKDEGLGAIDADDARNVGISAIIRGRRDATLDDISIQFGEAEGIFRTARQVDLGWHRGPTPIGRTRG